jgi:hypothetical protein
MSLEVCLSITQALTSPSPEQSDDIAGQRLRELISQCLNTRATQLNDAAHLLAHA